MSVLVTGFQAFGDIAENPSVYLAENSGADFRLLEVSYGAVDEFIASDAPAGYDAWLMIGVHGKSDTLRLETVAKNWVGTSPDVRGVVGGPSRLDVSLPPQLGATLWSDMEPGEACELTWDAGDYLCNYLFFKGLASYPKVEIGFLHVCLPEKLDLGLQLATVKGLVAQATAKTSERY